MARTIDLNGYGAMFYGEDLAHVHHTGFDGFARRAAPEVLTRLRGEGIERGLIVSLGCGSGLWARVFLDAGYEVLGVDLSPAMIALARTVAPTARYLVGSCHAIDIPRCAAVTALGEPLTYIGEEDPRDALPRLLRRIHSALEPGGILLFDLVLRGDEEPMRYRGTRQGPDWRAEVEVTEEPELSLLTRQITTLRTLGGAERRTVEIHRVRTFSRDDVEVMLRAAGFAVETHSGIGAVSLPPRRDAFLARKITSA
jgi:SAM-dependent methyltransferase